jgi:repressor LexA
MNFGEKIKKLRLDKNWNQEYVAQKLNISVPALSRYESGTYEPKSLAIISDFAKLYNVTTDYLLGLEVDYNSSEENSRRLLPVLGMVKAGYDYLAEENIIEYIDPHMNIGNPDDYFGLVVKGDSMAPLFDEGDYVVVHKQDDFESNKVCIVLINGDEATIKKVIKTNDGVELHCFNPYYPSRKYTFKEMQDLKIKIIGVVEQQIRNWK